MKHDRKNTIQSMSINNWHDTRNIIRKNLDELDLHSVTKTLWHSKINFFSNTLNGLLPCFFFIFRFVFWRILFLQISSIIINQTKSLKNNFFPYYVNELNNLKADIKYAKSLETFKKSIISENRKIPYFHFVIHSV